MSKKKLYLVFLLSLCIAGFLIYNKINDTLLYVSASGQSITSQVHEPTLEELKEEIDEDVAKLLEEEQLGEVVQENQNLSQEKMELIANIVSNGDDIPQEELVALINLIISSSVHVAVPEIDIPIEQPLPVPDTNQLVADPSFVQPISIAIVGKDTRKKGGSLNTDVIMVLVLEPTDKKMTLLSIPRDTKVKIPGYSRHYKVNSTYARGEIARNNAKSQKKPITVTGASLLKDTLSNLLGIPIQHYVLVDFEGFTKIIDQLNGIEVTVDKRMVYTDSTDGTHINLQPGTQLLNGKQALDYVRHRKDDRGSKYYSSDMDRNQKTGLSLT
ncbi:LCP family protein [Brevibacillus daliensis]|uniref:LCP family protein n=1 Tax=Brevibacillus daliensis TaxID=2892995 RepID=UPI001E2EF41F|nr:LCP family protein [Brevibacillus daliensis]